MTNSVAILARTNNALRIFETALTEAGVAYHLIGRSGFFAQNEVRAALSYLAAAVFPANYVISGLLRTDFHPTKFLPRTRLQARLKELRTDDDSVSYWKLMCEEPRTLVDQKNVEALSNFVRFLHGLSRYRSLPPADALKTVLGLLKVGDHFSETETPDNDPIANLNELVKLAARHQTIKGFLDYTRRASAASKSKKGIALSTCHSAKGMEFHTVYLVGCQEGLMPHIKATDLDEERNIYFVACSRAGRELVISYSGAPSPFLKGVV